VIHEISLNDCLSGTAPPERILTLGALDATVFVRICDVEQDSERETHTEVAEISVSLASLLEAVALLGADQEREHLRPVDRDGQGHETRLAGARLTVASAGASAAVGALTRHLSYTQSAKPTATGTGTSPQDPEAGKTALRDAADTERES
jgi:hypothetical protein